MFAALNRVIAAQSPEEIERQSKVLAALEPARLILTTVAYLVAAIYVNVWLCLGLAGIDAAAKIKGRVWMRGLDPARQPWTYLGTVAISSATELCFCLPAAIAWQQEDSFARSLALGLVAVSAAQQVTMRCVHLPYGLAGWVTALAVSLGANSLVWLEHDDIAGFAVSTVLIIGAGWLSLRFLLANHQIHDAMARDRLAAQAADKAKSLFLTQMSHELRTPLNAIIGMGVAELNEARTPEARQRMSTLVRSARGLATMLDDILNFSASEQGRLAIRPTAIDLPGEVESVVRLFRPLAEEQGMWISLSVGQGLPARVRLDGQRLRQCVTNLVSNALRHAGEGEISVTLAAEGEDGVVTVGDHGPGIAPELAERLFQPFQQGAEARGGSGLGLANARGIARAMGGDLVLVPAETGATFRLSFPLAPVEATEAGKDDAAAAGGSGKAQPNLRGASVLVVDDIAANRAVAAAFLKPLGARVLEAGGGDEALAMIAAENPQAVLLDMFMPEPDGLETFRRICGDAAARGIDRPRVLAMTADVADHKRRAYLDAGLDGFLPKPLDHNAMAQALATQLAPWLAGRRAS